MVQCNLISHCFTVRKKLLQIFVQPWVACYTGCQMFRTLLAWNKTFVFSDWSFMTKQSVNNWLHLQRLVIKISELCCESWLICWAQRFCKSWLYAQLLLNLPCSKIMCSVTQSQQNLQELKINCFSANSWLGLVQLINNCPALVSKHSSLWLSHCARPH